MVGRRQNDIFPVLRLGDDIRFRRRCGHRTSSPRHPRGTDRHGHRLDPGRVPIRSALGTDPSTPVDLWLGDVSQVPAGGTAVMRRLTEVNPWLADVDLGIPEEFTFRADPDGPEVQGWLLRPPGNSARSDTPAPLVVSVHGGPPFMYTAAFMFDFQVLRAQGFAGRVRQSPLLGRVRAGFPGH